MYNTFMNSKNSKIFEPHRLLLILTDKKEVINILLYKLSIYYSWKNIKKSYKNNKLNNNLWQGIKCLNYLMDHILCKIFKITLDIS